MPSPAGTDTIGGSRRSQPRVPVPLPHGRRRPLTTGARPAPRCCPPAGSRPADPTSGRTPLVPPRWNGVTPAKSTRPYGLVHGPFGPLVRESPPHSLGRSLRPECQSIGRDGTARGQTTPRSSRVVRPTDRTPASPNSPAGGASRASQASGCLPSDAAALIRDGAQAQSAKEEADQERKQRRRVVAARRAAR